VSESPSARIVFSVLVSHRELTGASDPQPESMRSEMRRRYFIIENSYICIIYALYKFMIYDS
jgi:hypothetical protein